MVTYMIVGVEDYRIKCIDVKDHRIKEGTDYSSHGQLVEREDKDFAPSIEKHANIVDKVHDLICRTDIQHSQWCRDGPLFDIVVLLFCVKEDMCRA